MPQNSEKFDFSKLEDQKQFERLSGEEQKAFVEALHDEALGINKALDENFYRQHREAILKEAEILRYDKEAKQNLRLAEESAESIEDDEERGDAFTSIAIAKARLGDFQGAEEIEDTEADIKRARILSVIAVEAHRRGDYELAKGALEKAHFFARKARFRKTEFYSYLAVAAKQLGNNKMARAFLERAMEGIPMTHAYNAFPILADAISRLATRKELVEKIREARSSFEEQAWTLKSERHFLEAISYCAAVRGLVAKGGDIKEKVINDTLKKAELIAKRDIGDNGDLAQIIWAEIAKTHVALGDIKKAVKITSSITDMEFLPSVLSAIAKAQLENNDLAGCKKILVEMEKSIKQLTYLGDSSTTKAVQSVFLTESAVIYEDLAKKISEGTLLKSAELNMAQKKTLLEQAVKNNDKEFIKSFGAVLTEKELSELGLGGKVAEEKVEKFWTPEELKEKEAIEKEAAAWRFLKLVKRAIKEKLEKGELSTAALYAKNLAVIDPIFCKEILAKALDDQKFHWRAEALAVRLNDLEAANRIADAWINKPNKRYPHDSHPPLVAIEFAGIKNPDLLKRTVEEMRKMGQLSSLFAAHKPESDFAKMLVQTDPDIAKYAIENLFSGGEGYYAAYAALPFVETDPEVARNVMNRLIKLYEDGKENCQRLVRAGEIALALDDKEASKTIMGCLEKEKSLYDLANYSAHFAADSHNEIAGHKILDRLLSEGGDSFLTQSAYLAINIKDYERVEELIPRIFKKGKAGEYWVFQGWLKLTSENPTLGSEVENFFITYGKFVSAAQVALALNDIAKAENALAMAEEKNDTYAIIRISSLLGKAEPLEKIIANPELWKNISQDQLFETAGSLISDIYRKFHPMIVSLSMKEKNDLLSKATALKDREFIESFGAALSGTTEVPSKEVLTAYQNALLNLGRAEYREFEELPEKGRIFKETREKLREILGKKRADEKTLTKVLSNTLYHMGTDEAKQVLLEELRSAGIENPHMARLAKTLAEMDSLKGKDLIVSMIGDEQLPRQYAFYFLKKLIEQNYLDYNLKAYLEERRVGISKLPDEEKIEKERYFHQVLREVVGTLHINPDTEVLKLILDRDWGTADLKEIIGKIQEMKSEFENISDKDQLVHALTENKEKATVFYTLYGGKTHFELVNSYNSEKFHTILRVADELKLHDRPLEQFEKSLEQGLDKQTIIKQLKGGKFPFGDGKFAKAIRVDVSNSAQYETLERESREIFGKTQFGVILKYKYYRDKLQKPDPTFAEKLDSIEGLTDAEHLIDEIEEKYPDLGREIEKRLEKSWRKIGEKNILSLSLTQVLSERENSVSFDDLSKNLEIQRKALMSSIRQQYKSGSIEKMVRDEKLQALEEKGRAKLLKFILQEVITKDKPSEQLSRLLSEWESHLAGAFETYQSLKGQEKTITKKEKSVTLRYLDKRDDLIEFFRFADSAQCCFTSTSYRIEGYNIGNAEWIARVWKDPLSFVFEIEDTEPNAERREAIGFVFGSFGIENRELVVLLNGVYMKGKTDVAAANILQVIEDNFTRQLKAKRQVVASRHAGVIKPPKEYSNKQLTLTRLRALSAYSGEPETKIYDDLNVGVNEEKKTDQNLWWKESKL